MYDRVAVRPWKKPPNLGNATPQNGEQKMDCLKSATSIRVWGSVEDASGPREG